MNSQQKLRSLRGRQSEDIIERVQDFKQRNNTVTQSIFYKDNSDFESRSITHKSSSSSSDSTSKKTMTSKRARSAKSNDKLKTFNKVKLSDVLMSGPALVSKKAGARNASQRFVVLTSNMLCCYKEFGIGPCPTDAIEVQKIVNIHCSLPILTVTVSTSHQSQNLVLTLDTRELFIAWKRALSKIGCSITGDEEDEDAN